MKLRNLIFTALRFTGIPLLIRETLQKNKVTILLFHDIDKKATIKIFRYLRANYNIISLKTFIEASETNNDDLLPPKALIITFDDGHIGNYKLLPVVKKLDIPITIFLCAGIINTNRNFWFNYVQKKSFKEKLKKFSNHKRLKILSDKGFRNDKEFNGPVALTKEQIQEMMTAIDFQSHTIFHPCLPACNDEEAEVEIVNSKQILENEFDLTISTISYPNGDYTSREVILSHQAGYRGAITVDPGYNTIKSDTFRLKRFSVNDSDNLNELCVKASGIWAIGKSIIDKLS